ncbi:hypothetical protein BDW59DRAFT_146167 [Aspergillus cavernicola]|uniref:Ell binding protein Ebp1 C-terminal domain-containing protein n=1 Tax=Aspergillus cavernicola TaxID=176166 RepID=A0ABR4ICD7_9EURO
MSSRSTDNAIRPSTTASGRSNHSEQDLIDRRLKHLREEVLPFYPYLLTLPTDVPFRLGNRFVNNWAVSDDGPFAPEEQQLQYMTFLTHDESDSLLVAVGDWSDGTGNVMADPRSRPQSATSTPSSGSIKKKISLNDYKNKRTNGNSPYPLNQEAPGHHNSSTLHVPYDNHTSTSKPFPTSDNRQKLPKKNLSPNSFAPSDSEHVDRKRPSERDHDRYAPQGKDGTSAKRRRLSHELARTHPKLEPSNSNGLPELLSPTLPPTSANSRTPRLPRLLSPTLPPDLERELAKLGNDPVASDSQPEPTVTSDATKAKTPKERLPARSIPESSTTVTGPQKLHGKSPGLGSEKNPSRGTETAKSSSHTASKTNLQPQTGCRPAQPSSTKSVPSSSKLRLIVKLKYGRPNRRRVEGLLKFSGKRKLSHQSSPATDAVEQEPPHAMKAEQPRVSASEQSNKIIRLDGKTKPVASNQPISSRRDRPKEPRQAVFEKSQTPILNQAQQDKLRQVSITPAKDLKHSSSRQDLTNNDGKGHYSTVARSTLAEPALGTNKQSPPQPSSVERNGERRAWKDEYQKYGNLGRELKHAADRHTAKDRVTSTDEKLAAATAIEAILCFVLAFVADDQSKVISRQVGDSSTWLSIIAYWRVVRKNSSAYPPLNSLCLILGAVSYDAIHALDLERLAATPIPGEHTPVPTPASDGHSVNSDENKRSFKDFLELKTRLPEFYKESQRMWSDGSRGFTEDILAREFPDTWSRRARSYSEQGKKRLKPGAYSGEIYLPLGKTSTALEIIRFSCAFLREWCSKENIDWRGKLDL